MYRTAALILALAVVFFVVRSAEEPVQSLQRSEVRPAPEVFEMARSPSAKPGTRVERASEGGNWRIGDFEPPARVPDYEIIEEKVNERDGARAARLLVDTSSRAEEEFVFIARDLKALYSDYDAVSVQFTDTEDLLFYDGGALDPVTRDLLAHYGGALIYNTYKGVEYLGYVYGPPNMQGYYVKATY